MVASASCVAPDDDEERDETIETAGEQLVGGKRVVDGDIVVEHEDEAPAPAEPVLTPQLYAREAKSLYWPNGTVPFAIDSSVSTTHRSRIAASIKEWQAKTVVRWVPRKNEAAYVTFTEPANNNICSANLGHVAGARRFVYLRDTDTQGTCNLGVVVHEMGHTIGLVHEHQRPDRDQFVKINTICIPTGLTGAFAFTTTPSKKVGPYDILSTMHYRSTTLTKAGCYSITAKSGQALLHDWATLSAGDVAGVAMLYGAVTPKPPPPADAGTDAAPEAVDAAPPPPPPVEAPAEEDETTGAAPLAPRVRDPAEPGGCSTSPKDAAGSVANALIFLAFIAVARGRSSRRSSTPT